MGAKMRIRIDKLTQHYKEMSLPLKVSGWFFFCSLLQKGLAFFTTPLFTRVLDTADYGIVSVYHSWEQIIIIFITMNLADSVLNVGLVKYHDNKDEFQTSLLALEFVWAAIMSFAFLLGYPFLYPYVRLETKFVAVMLTHCFFWTVMCMWTQRQRFEYRYRKMAAVTLINTFGSVALSVVLVFFMEDRAFGKVLGGAAAVVIPGIFCVADCLGKNRKIKPQYWKFALKYNIPMIPHFLSSVILNQLDRIMIQNMCGLNQAGIYAVAYNSASVIYIVNQALGASYNPWMLQRLRVKKYDHVKETVNTILLVYLMALLVFILFAPEIMRFMASRDYYEGIYMIPPVACSMFFILLFNLFSPVEYFSMKTKFMGIASMVSAGMNIVLNAIFIQLYGYLAAGYTTLACYMIYAMTHYLYMKKCCGRLGIPGLFDHRKILLMSLAVTTAALVSAAIYPYYLLRYFIILMMCVAGFFLRKRIRDTVKRVLSA